MREFCVSIKYTKRVNQLIKGEIKMNAMILNDGTSTYEDKFVELMRYCFKVCKEEDFRKDWAKSTSRNEKYIIMGTEIGDELATSITLIKRAIYLDGKKLSMYGVGGVATASTHRSGGACTRLVKEGIQKMYREGVVFSMLAPFSYEFYEKLGWKWCYTSWSYSFEIERLKGFKNEGKIEKIRKDNFELLDTYYHQWIRTMNGMTERDEDDWFKRVDGGDDRYTIVYRNNQGEVLGYMIYKIDHEKSAFQVIELSYQRLEAIKAFYQYIYMHRAQVKQVTVMTVGDTKVLDILSNPGGDTRELCYMMGRIINVEEALRSYTFQKDGMFYVSVTDDILEENTGCFKVVIENGGVTSVAKVVDEDKIDFKIDIRELTQLIIGFRTMDELVDLEKVTVYNEEVKSCFKDKRSEVGLYDFF